MPVLVVTVVVALSTVDVEGEAGDVDGDVEGDVDWESGLDCVVGAV